MADRDPAGTATDPCLLHALPDLALAHIVSHLTPPEAFSLSSCCKSLRDACLAHLTTLTLHWRGEDDEDSPSAPEGTVERWQQHTALLSLMRRTHSLKALVLSSFEYLSMLGEVLRAGYARNIEALALQDIVSAEMLWSVDDYGVIGCAMEAGALSRLKSLELGPIHEDFFRHVTSSLSNGPCPNLTSLTLSISASSSLYALAEALEARARQSTRRCELLRELTICSDSSNVGQGFERLLVTSSVCDDLRELALHGIVRMDFLASYLTRTRNLSSLEYFEVEGYTADHEVDPGPDASPIFRALSHGAAPKLQSLLLERCHVTTDCADYLSMAVARDDILYHLNYLSLADVFEVQSEMTGFFSALAGLCHGCPNLRTIEFDHSGGSGACAAVAKCLNEGPLDLCARLERLTLSRRSSYAGPKRPGADLIRVFVEFADVLRAGWGRTIEAIAVQDEMYDLSTDHYTVIGCSMEAGALPMLKSLESGPIPEAFFHHLTDSLSKGPCADLTSLTLSITEISMINMLIEALEARARHSTRRSEPLRGLTICCTKGYRGEGVDRLFVASSVCDDLRELALYDIGNMEFLAAYLTRTPGVKSLEYLEVEGYIADHEDDPGPDASPIFRALSHGAAPKLQSLLLERCHVNTQCAEHLHSAVACLDALHHLRYLSLTDVFEVQSEMESFFNALAGLCPPCRGCPHLQTIEFDHNGCSGACDAVARCLSNLAFPRLQELVIHARTVRDIEIQALAEASLRRVKAVRYRSRGAYAEPCKALTRVVVSRQSGGVMHIRNQQRLATLVQRGAFRGVKELQLPVYLSCV